MSQLYDDEIFGNFYKKVMHYQYHIVSVVLLVFAAFVGYNYHLESVKKFNSSAADYYTLYNESCESKDTTTSLRTLELLQSRYKSHLYASLATLEASKSYIDKSNFAQAKTQLEWVTAHSSVPLFKDIAHYKLAEIARASKDYNLVSPHVAVIQGDDLKIIGQRIEAASYADQGMYEESSDLYASLLEKCSDPAFKALLTREYHITNLLLA